jgi:hypothetical protein
MQYIGAKLFEQELKKSSTELLILSLVEQRPRHGYEISKLIEQRSEGLLKFNVASFYPLLYRRAISSDILHFPARVLVRQAATSWNA